MSKSVFAAALCFGLFVMIGGSAGAQGQSTDADRTVRPGDTIEWFGPSAHRVQFGGTGGEADTPLTPLGDVDKVLSFSPALTIDGDMGLSAKGGSPMLSATVKEDAVESNVATFDFTCGIHPDAMRSLPWTIAAKDGQPPRTLTVKAAPGFKWMLVRPDGTEVQIDEP